MSAHFSSLYEQSGGLVQWSPDGRYVAMAVGQRLMVRDATDAFEIVQVCVCCVRWSPKEKRKRSEHVALHVCCTTEMLSDLLYI